MQQEVLETPVPYWHSTMEQVPAKHHFAGIGLQISEHPWLAQMTGNDDEDSLGEMLRYALDEIRFV